MFKEKRLTYFAQNDDSTPKAEGTPSPTVPSDSEKSNKEKEETDFNTKIADLRTRNEQSNNDSITKEYAVKALATRQKEAVVLVESLLKGSSSQGEFIEKITAFQDKQNKVKAKSLPTITDAISKRANKVGKLKNRTPEEKKMAKEFGSQISSLEKINKADKLLQSEVEALLSEAQKAKKITPQDVKRIGDLDPANEKFEELLNAYLGNDLKKDKKLVSQLKVKKAKQLENSAKFDSILNGATNILEKQIDTLQDGKKEYAEKRYIRRLTGIYPNEGTLLEFNSVDSNLQKITRTTEIQKVEFVAPNKDLLEEIDNGEIDREDAYLDELSSDKEIQITVTAYTDGSPEELVMSRKQFIEWVNTSEVTEVTDSIADLNKKIDFADYMQELKVGTEIEYQKNDTNGMQSVKVIEIDEVNRKIKLDAPVVIMNREYKETPNRVKSELTFGEFAKWFNRNKASEKIEMPRLREILNRMPLVLKTRYPNMDPRIWQFNETPIKVEPGEELIMASNTVFKIDEVSDTDIKLSNGRSYTPGQFLRYVKDNEIERKNKFRPTDQVKDKIEDALAKSEDALPPEVKESNEIVATGEEDISRSMIEDVWANINFLSINDLIKMWETITDYLKRNIERNSKRRAANTGKKLPGRLGLEFQNLAQSSENEMVNKFKEDLEQQGVDDIRNAMISAKGNTDLIKACIILLCSKGSFDWEDPKMWVALNQAFYVATNGSSDYENFKINVSGGYSAQNEKPVEAMKRVMDRIWGKPGGKDWFNENKGAYDSEMNKAKTEAIDFENDPNDNGAVAAELHNMLVKHAKGEYVPPYRFEGFLTQIIEAGKASPEDKMFYLMAGYLVQNPNSDEGLDSYLLPKRRIAVIEGKLLNNLPHLDYFTRFAPDGKNILERNAMGELFKKFLFNQNEVKRRTPDMENRFDQKAVKNFLWKDVMTFENVLRRASKAARVAENMDHDDAHILIPMMEDSNVLQNVITNVSGQKGKFSMEGYANGVTGYTEYLKNLAELSKLPPEEIESRQKLGFRNPKKLVQGMFKSWMIYEASLTGRVSFGNYTTLSSDLLNGYALTDDKKTVQQHANEVREILRKVLQAYKVPESQIKVFLDLKTGSRNKEANEAHRQEIRKFSNYFDRLINQDQGAKMMQIVQGEYDAGALLGFEGASKVGDKDAIEKAKAASEAANEAATKRDEDNDQELADPNEIINASRKAVSKTQNKSKTKKTDDDDINIDEDGNKIE